MIKRNKINPKIRQLATGLAFLAPNITGVLVFVVFPIFFSIFMAFTNWNLRYHNIYKPGVIEFIGLDNFIRLVTEDDFLRFLGNTLFMMLGIPFCVMGSLFAALLLSRNMKHNNRRIRNMFRTGLICIVCAVIIGLIMCNVSLTTLLVFCLGSAILIAGAFGGSTVYRTLFYTPHFTAGVATYLIWKKLFSPDSGPINQALSPVLNVCAEAVNAVPAEMIHAFYWIGAALIILLTGWFVSKLGRFWDDGEIGNATFLFPCIGLSVLLFIAFSWERSRQCAWYICPGIILCLLWQIGKRLRRKREFTCGSWSGSGSILILSGAVTVFGLIILALSVLMYNLPEMAADGLKPPRWIYDYHFAKPSLMMMGLWAAIGSNNMLLYLAALTNIPRELYEAADVDGASRLQRFWHITWPQLAATTFFIIIMSVIGGLQGGFEMARTMTAGGPAGATTTLSYFIYLEGFDTGRLSFAAAASWLMFLLILSITIFNWKFGNKYVND